MSKLYMFSTTDCTKCPEVKEALIEKDIEVEYIDAEGVPPLVMRFIITTVPTIIDNREHAEDKYIGQKQCLAFVNTL